jgi:hypothetical protein
MNCTAEVALPPFPGHNENGTKILICNRVGVIIVLFYMKYFIFILLVSMHACDKHTTNDSQESKVLFFGIPKKVTILGYSGDAMEPFISRNGQVIFFNNLNDPAVNTNLFYANRINDTLFEFKGEITGANSSALDAVATMDNKGNFYFVSTRSYSQTFSTIYTGTFQNGNLNNITLLPGVSKEEAGYVNFDVEVSADGNTLYFVDAKFDNAGQPQTATLAMAEKTATGFKRISNSGELLENINSDMLVYAAGISDDELTLFFTRVPQISSSAIPRIYYATRNNKSAPFNNPHEITTIPGFVEAATVAGDSLVYFHKKENNQFGLYCSKWK